MSIMEMNSIDNQVITTMVREGISIGGITGNYYHPMSVEQAINLHDELCEDCKDLLRSLVSKGLQEDFLWRTVNATFIEVTGHYARGTCCEYCKDVKKQIDTDTLKAPSPQTLDSITLNTTLKEEDTCGYRGDGANDPDNIPII